jgi:hypothetical protein
MQEIENYEFRVDAKVVVSVPHLIQSRPAVLDLNHADRQTDKQTDIQTDITALYAVNFI